MPTIAARIAHAAIAREIAGRAPDRTLDQARRDLDEGGGRLHPPASVTIADGTEGGVPGEWLTPAGADRTARILYLHGGAYVVGSRRSHRGLAGKVADEVGAPAFLAEYRLAPEHRFPAAVDDAMAAYLALAEEVDPGRVLVVGDSAGGGLSLALAVALRDRGHPLPGAVVGFSPWTDLTGSGDSIFELGEIDVMLDGGRMPEVAAEYHGETPADHPLVSPLFADLAGLPPILLQAGGAEILRDDSVRFHQRATAAGTDSTLRIYPDMWHVWHAFWPWVPEGRAAIREAARFWWSQTASEPPQRRSTL